jgi:hypothetical protein
MNNSQEIIEIINSVKEGKPENYIFTTIGLYPSCDYKTNGVSYQNIDYHIEYNLDYRFGRALIIDGVCVYKGNVSDENIESFISKHKSLKIFKDTAPYH